MESHDLFTSHHFILSLHLLLPLSYQPGISQPALYIDNPSCTFHIFNYSSEIIRDESLVKHLNFCIYFYCKISIAKYSEYSMDRVTDEVKSQATLWTIMANLAQATTLKPSSTSWRKAFSSSTTAGSPPPPVVKLKPLEQRKRQAGSENHTLHLATRPVQNPACEKVFRWFL